MFDVTERDKCREVADITLRATTARPDDDLETSPLIATSWGPKWETQGNPTSVILSVAWAWLPCPALCEYPGPGILMIARYASTCINSSARPASSWVITPNLLTTR